MPYIELTKQNNKSSLAIMIFTEGTVLGPRNILEFFFCSRYIPLKRCVEKISLWEANGAEIQYVTSRKKRRQVEDIQFILTKFGFPGSRLYYRGKNQKYKDIIEEVMPDILIEDDCKCIGGQWQMCITYVKPELKEKIKSVVIKEFKGIDHLPNEIADLWT